MNSRKILCDIQFGPDPAARGKALYVARKSGCKSHLIQQGWVKQIGYGSNFRRALFYNFNGIGNPFRLRRVQEGGVSLQSSEVHMQCDQILTGAVMQFPSDSPGFVIPGLEYEG